MGWLSGSKKDHQAAAARLTSAAKRETKKAQEFKAEAEKVRKSNRNSRYPDHAAARAITRDLDANRRICEKNAKDLRDMAAGATRLSKKWF